MRIGFNPAISITAPKAGQINFGSFWDDIRNTARSLQGPARDTFDRQEVPVLPPEPDDPYNILGKEGKFRVTDYDNVVPKGPEFAKLKMDEDVRSAADRSAHLGFKLKKRLDRLYGRNKYVFVSIGTKSSLIGKTFEFQGAETKYLPTSRSRKWDENYKENDMRMYKSFMESQGLSREAMENSGKKYLFFDSTNKNNCLDDIKDLMVNEFGLPEDKMEFRSLDVDLKKVKAPEDVIQGYIDLYLTRTMGEKYSSIEYLPNCNYDESTFKPEALTRYTDSEVRKFNYLIMDRLNEAEVLEEAPENDDTL